MARIPGDATAYAHRDAELMIMTIAAGPAAAVEASRPALNALWRRLAPYVSGRYANFLSTATGEDVAAIYPARTYERPAAVKRQCGPGDLFARNRDVRPQRG